MPSDCVPIPQLETSERAECRKTERITVQREVRLRTSDHREFTALCTDINFSGIGIDTDLLLRVGQRLELKVESKKGAHSVPMLVIYRMGKHYGLSALSALDEVLELLPLNS